MLTPDMVVSVLKYAGLCVSAFATIWGLMSKTSYDDAEGHKRLTFAGKVAVATALVSALVGMLAFGFETFQRDQARRDAARDRLLAEAAVDRREAAAEKRTARLERRRTKDVERARFLVLRAMAQQASGDAYLARRLAENNAGVIGGFSDTLYQIQRVSQPIRTMTIDLTSIVPLKGIKGDEYVKRLLSAVATAGSPVPDAEDTELRLASDGLTSWRTAAVGNRSPLFPKLAGAESEWFELLTGRMRFAFFAGKISSKSASTRHRIANRYSMTLIGNNSKSAKPIVPQTSVDPDDPDIAFEVQPSKIRVLYSTLDDYLTIKYHFELPWADSEGTGRMTSQLDLDSASLLISSADFSRIYKNRPERYKIPNAERVCEINVDTGLRRLVRRQFQRVETSGGMDILAWEIGSYRAPSLYVDPCNELEPGEG